MEPVITRHGGARAGAGRKPNGHIATPVALEFEAARAKNEAAKAQLNQLKADEQSGKVINREAVRQASATLLAVLAQSLQSLPDNLERRHGLAPEVVEGIAKDVDTLMQEMASVLRAMHGGH